MNRLNLNKHEILTCIIMQLQADVLILEQAVELARDTATHADCLGSSKYETMGLEASYLAQGQGVRLLEVERALKYFIALAPIESHNEASDVGINFSSLLLLQDDGGNEKTLWLAAQAGGLKVDYGDKLITVITPQAPLGRALMGKVAGDAFELSIAGNICCYDIVAVC